MSDVASRNDEVRGEEGMRRLRNRIVPGVAARHDEVWGEQASKWKEYPFSVSNVMGKG